MTGSFMRTTLVISEKISNSFEIVSDIVVVII